MKMKKQNKNQRRARVDRAVDRNEFIRLGQSVKNEASGASGAPEGKKKFKKIQKDYVPVVLPEAGLDSSAEKPKKKYRGIRASPSLLNAGSAALDGSGEFNDAEGNQGGENVIEVQGWVSGPDDAEPLDAEGDLTFAEPAGVVPAEKGKHAARGRGLIVSRLFPIAAVDRSAFAQFVRDFSFEEYYLQNIKSSKIRRLVLKDLRLFYSCSALVAEKLLQMSYLVYNRFISGDRGDPVEHYAIACAIGQIILEGSDSYDDHQWEHHDVGEVSDTDSEVARRLHHELNGDAFEVGPAGRAAVNMQQPKSKSASVKPAAAPSVISVDSDADSPAPAPRDASVKKSSPAKKVATIQRITVPVVRPAGINEADDGHMSYAESLARELRNLRVSSPATSALISNLAVDQAISTLRKSLPASLAEGAIQGLLAAQENLQTPPAKRSAVVPETPPTEPAELGKSYRVGQLAKEAQAFAHHVNRSGARAERGKYAPLGLVATLRKAIDGRGEFAHLNSKQRMQALARSVRQELHEADLERQGLARKAAAGGDGDGSSGGSSGESCNDSVDSRRSSETYELDEFCVSDKDGGDGSDGSGDGGDSSGSDSQGDDDEGKRALSRKHSANSLGTPVAKAQPGGVETVPAVLSTNAGKGPSLVLLGDEDLPLWKSGPARFKQGFHWESYLHHKQQYDNYKAHRGRYSERTFKSVIDIKLVPAVCASCGFKRTSWNNLPDHRLILRIERVLRPSKSTDFAMELKAITLERFGSESLLTSYVTYAERFLCKAAEAADAGRPINSVVIKAAFKKAVDSEVPLKTWLEGVKWRGVDHAHKRLLRKLREARSWEAMTRSAAKPKRSERRDDEDGHEGDVSPARRPFKQRARAGKGNATTRKGRAKGRGNATRTRSRRANSTGPRDQGRQQQPRRDRDAREGRSGPKAEKLRTWKGYNDRGESWHTNRELFDCYKKPCNAMFCQRCGTHGHTADYCRVPDGTEGLNGSGYFQEERPGKAGPKRPPPRNNSSGGRRDRDDYDGDDASAKDSESHANSSDDDAGGRRGGRSHNNSSRGRGGRNCL
jgi:hypothetical protein